jgi:hypothetical protein
VRSLSFLAGTLFALTAAAGATSAAPQAAASAPPAHPGAPAVQAAATPSALIPYERFAAGATPQRGLFTIWRKDGNVAMELRPDQFNQDFVELGVPVNGVGSGLSFFFSGMTDLQNCRIIRFVKQDNRVAILFPSTRFLAKANTPEQAAVAAGSPNSVAGVAKVLSVDTKTGNVVFDASPFLQDLTDVADYLTFMNGGHPLTLNPMGAYRLDSSNTYFGVTKAFPENVTIVANQTFSTANPQFIDTPTDPRNLEIQLQYNIAALPKDDAYMPRLYDDRVGYFVNAHADFSSDDTFNKEANYIVRWNVQPSDPSKKLSPAKHPVVYYLSNTIPLRYRPAIRKALLTWNKAFQPLGLNDVVEVKDQPNDPNFDPDDIRYNVVRWLAETEGGFAEAQLLYNPYTGEMIKSGIVIDSDLMRFGKFDYPNLVQPERTASLPPTARALGGEDFVQGERAQFGYGMAALALVNGESGYYVPEKFANEFLESIVLHESGHDWGLRHNYLGSQSYSATQLRSPAFTQKYGVASSVMEYSPINLWPKGQGQGEYFQTVLGPYDYYVIHWGYAGVPGARSPQDETRTLNHWASQWSDSRYSYSSDEDTMWSNGAAVDPRNQQWDLTNDNIGWCETRMKMSHDLITSVGRRFPRYQGSYDDLRMAFASLLGQSSQCAVAVSRYIGGEYISRARRGDPRAEFPLAPIPKSEQLRAFKVLERGLFSADAWNFSPALLRQAVTQYRFDDWDGNMAPRHDIPVEQLASFFQYIVVNRMFAPVTLQRLDDMQFKYGPGKTMDIADLFTWMQSAVYGDLSHPAKGNIPLVRRNLQRNYASLLSRLANEPAPNAPQDAQALARYELTALHRDLQGTLARGKLDLITRAHLASLDTDVERALHAQVVVPTVRS